MLPNVGHVSMQIPQEGEDRNANSSINPQLETHADPRPPKMTTCAFLCRPPDAQSVERQRFWLSWHWNTLRPFDYCRLC